jgi:hypothetical protein
LTVWLIRLWPSLLEVVQRVAAGDGAAQEASRFQSLLALEVEEEGRAAQGHVVVFGESHLRYVLSAYAAYYNQTCPHRSLQKDVIAANIPTDRRHRSNPNPRRTASLIRPDINSGKDTLWAQVCNRDFPIFDKLRPASVRMCSLARSRKCLRWKRTSEKLGGTSER